ncbi:MAG TPA: hypothetical protein DCE56_04015 [Cyanobacteria bacterium UBA8553]|nr:hypothetical protein [Cyanobacteria bacterium UBA8553]HAJ58448.1 hypothetical protein [Cyanobacteria bacterium UBA8543]
MGQFSVSASQLLVVFLNYISQLLGAYAIENELLARDLSPWRVMRSLVISDGWCRGLPRDWQILN